MVNGTNAAIKKFAKLYPKFTFKRTTINTWKTKYQKNGNETVLKSIGRPNLLSDILLKKTKDIIIGTRLAGTVISRRMVMAIGTGVVKANDPSLLKERWSPTAHRRLDAKLAYINGLGKTERDNRKSGTI